MSSKHLVSGDCVILSKNPHVLKSSWRNLRTDFVAL